MRSRLVPAAVLAMTACTRQVVAPGPEVEIVRGEWEWASSCCSIAGVAKDPSTEGYIYVLQYSEDGTVRAFRNNDLVLTTRFTIKTSKPDPLADAITTITYDDELPHGPQIPAAKTHVVFRLEKGELALHNQGCADCYSDWRFLPRLTGGN